MSWYYRTAGTIQGPIEREGLVNLLRGGTLTPQVEVSEDSSTWLIAPQVPGLMAEVLGTPESAIPTPPQAPAAAPTPSPSPIDSAPSTDLAGPPPTQSSPIVPAPIQPQPQTPPASTGLPSPSLAPQPSPPASNPSDLPGPGSPAPIPSASTNFAPPSPPIPTPEPEPEPSENDTATTAPSDEEPTPQPSGPVAHITFDPEARAKRKVKSDRNPSMLKLAICGILGLAVMGAAGLFAANKFFGIDLRPASINRSVSKFMPESPEVIAHLDVKKVLRSPAYRHSPFASMINSNPAAGHLSDVEEATFVMDEISGTAPQFLVILKLARDYRPEFFANMYRDAPGEKAGEFVMHTDPNSLSRAPVSISLPEPRLALLGSPAMVRGVLERNEFPKLFPRESELIALTTGSGKAVSASLFLDSAKKAFLKSKNAGDEKLKEMDKRQREAIEEALSEVKKTFDGVEYALKNVHHLHFTVDLGDSITVTTQAECGTKGKAKKILKVFNDLMANAPAGMNLNLGQSTTPEVKGSMVEYRNVIKLGELNDALGSQFTSTGF